jgi:hypothetical protein
MISLRNAVTPHEEVEVIGNIYENPELLDPQQQDQEREGPHGSPDENDSGFGKHGQREQ